MTQINEYTTEALTLGNDDLLDIDKDMGGGNFESQKVKWGTVVSAIGAASNNLGNTNLTQTDTDRIFDGDGKSLDWNNMRKFWVNMLNWNDDPDHGFRVKRDMGAVLTDKNRLVAEFLTNLQSLLRIYEEGRVDIREGGLGVSDGSLSLTLGPNNSSNAGLIALFMSMTKPSVFTDIIYPEAPVEVNDSFITWFRTISKGVRFPTMSELQRDGILTPELGLVIYNLDANKMQVYTGIGVSGWSNMN